MRKLMLRQKVFDVLQIFEYWRLARNQSLEEWQYVRNRQVPVLSHKEKQEIEQKWRGVVGNLNNGLAGYRIWKSLYGFDVNYIPFGYFFPWILRKLNPIEYSLTYENKGMQYDLFPESNHPNLVVRKLNGAIYDSNRNFIDLEAAIGCIASYPRDMIIKPCSDSCCGRGVRKLQSGIDRKEVKAILALYEDFVVQECIEQHPSTAVFNPSSLNTMRISTLLLNGKFSLCTAMIRFGEPGSVVDNVGAGGACVGINDDGSIMEFGFDARTNKIYEWNGVTLKGRSIPYFDRIIEAASIAHKSIPLCAFVGWDIALDKSGIPMLIEVNLGWPGLFYEQLANARPALRGREDEVIQYASSRPKSRIINPI